MHVCMLQTRGVKGLSNLNSSENCGCLLPSFLNNLKFKSFFLILSSKDSFLFNSSGVKWSELEDDHLPIVPRFSMHTAISVPSPVCHHCMVFNPLKTAGFKLLLLRGTEGF